MYLKLLSTLPSLITSLLILIKLIFSLETIFLHFKKKWRHLDLKMVPNEAIYLSKEENGKREKEILVTIKLEPRLFHAIGAA